MSGRGRGMPLVQNPAGPRVPLHQSPRPPQRHQPLLLPTLYLPHLTAMFHLLFLAIEPPKLQSNAQRMKPIKASANSTVNIKVAVKSIKTTQRAEAQVPLLPSPSPI
eukprot:9472535-Pyramimonas_sp.AAC.1